MARWLLLGVESSREAGLVPRGGRAGELRASQDGPFNARAHGPSGGCFIWYLPSGAYA